MIEGAIIGGAGYTGGELLRLSQMHPDLEITQIISQSQAGKPVQSVHLDIMDSNLSFTSELVKEPKVAFLCMGHGQSKKFLENNPDISDYIIDLSQDHRLIVKDNPFQYGLPEVYGAQIKTSNQVSNPGCFATAIQLGLLPIAANGLITDDVHIHAITGSTGAGQSLRSTSHFSWRNNNVSTYKVFEHQHLHEIKQTLAHVSNRADLEIHFVPMRGPFTRGIYASIYTPFEGTEADARALYREYYAHHPFVKITDQNPDLKQVVNTNNALIHIQKKGAFIYSISMIDNLLKGAVGQALQNMNLMFGLDESTGLNLKSSYF